MTEKFPQLAVVVPCYNVQDVCADVINRLKPYGCAVIAVDDGSMDQTYSVLSNLGVIVIQHEVNRGKGHALRSGFHYMLEQGRWTHAATIDADGQHDPDEIPALMKLAADQQIDLLIGARQFDRSKMPIKRWIANKISSFLISKLIRTDIKDIQSGYRIYSRRFLESIFPEVSSAGFEIETELLILALRRKAVIREAPIRSIYSQRANQLSNWKAFHDSVRIAKTILRHYFQK
ncbi:MAG: glycosyltransferase family 2 protein [Candidatus Omnitrophica bacterium]|nr:glycosyltransferase family 2 protein [Candidatus Omnitrophota bacterium]